MALEDFIDLITIDPIDNWQQLNQQHSINLISEILENIGNEALTTRNSEALEKRYSKPEGTVINLIFHKDLNNPEEIMNELKKETKIFL